MMKWSNLKGQMWGGATLPITHDGEFYNIELQVNNCTFQLPPRFFCSSYASSVERGIVRILLRLLWQLNSSFWMSTRAF